MSKQTPFFKFDAMQWLGGAIQQCTLEEKGLFIDLCAHYWKHYKPVKLDAKFKVRYRYLQGRLNELITALQDLEFIEVSEAGITVKFLDDLMDDRQGFLEKCSKAGKKSASIKGTSSIKKEECREKSVDIRVKKEPAGAVLHDKVVKAIEWPDSFDDEMQELFLMFLSERRTSKKYVTENAIKGLFKKLSGFSRVEQVTAINDAIVGGYQGLFPKVFHSSGPVQNTTRLPTTEELSKQEGVASNEDELQF